MQTVYYDIQNVKGPQREIGDKVAAAARIVREGGIVAIPKETVYGLGANGLDETAVHRLFQVKDRPQDNPMILHLCGPAWLPRYCVDIPPVAFVLTRKFWPGPLTLVLKRHPKVPYTVTAGLETVAVRCPNNPIALAIIREAGVPIAAPSANLSGRPCAVTAQEVMEDMDGRINGIVDGGPCPLGIESTILDLTGDRPLLLRPGAVPLESIESLIGPVALDKSVTRRLKEGEESRIPGAKYLPELSGMTLTAFNGAPENTAREMERRMGRDTGILCFDEFAGIFPRHEVRSLGPYADQSTQAARLYPALRSFERSSVKEVFVQCPDSRGLGLAVGNRLKRAAAFHVVESDVQRIVLGLTGGTCSGKTTALSVLRDMGAAVIDCDYVYHRLLEDNETMRNEINSSFPGVFTLDGKLNRRRLGEEVFRKKERMDRLNGIVYKYLMPILEAMIDSVREGLCAVDGITLLESGLDRLCDRTIAVTAPIEVRVRRVVERDNCTEEYARLRISAQKTDEFYRSKCDYELSSAVGTEPEFRAEAEKFFTKLVEALEEEKRHGVRKPQTPIEEERSLAESMRAPISFPDLF